MSRVMWSLWAVSVALGAVGQTAADRPFYRSRYDARQIVDAFTARLRDEADLDDVRTQLLGAVHATGQPRGASVWLRERV